MRRGSGERQFVSPGAGTAADLCSPEPCRRRRSEGSADGGAVRLAVHEPIADERGDVAAVGPLGPYILLLLIRPTWRPVLSLTLSPLLGSATVAVVTASGVVLPLLAGSGVHPEMPVLAVSCGSIVFSHVNDPWIPAVQAWRPQPVSTGPIPPAQGK
nr:putative gluconate permease [uncultured bacterium]